MNLLNSEFVEIQFLRGFLHVEDFIAIFLKWFNCTNHYTNNKMNYKYDATEIFRSVRSEEYNILHPKWISHTNWVFLIRPKIREFFSTEFFSIHVIFKWNSFFIFDWLSYTKDHLEDAPLYHRCKNLIFLPWFIDYELSYASISLSAEMKLIYNRYTLVWTMPIWLIAYFISRVFICAFFYFFYLKINWYAV